MGTGRKLMERYENVFRDNITADPEKDILDVMVGNSANI